METDVFISYSSKDTVVANAVCHILEENNISCWMAPRDVVPGDNYAHQIIQAIKNSSIIVLIFSKNANQSMHVGNEVDRAFNSNKPIIPFVIEETDINEDLDYYLSRKHWLVAYPDYKSKTESLVSTVLLFLNKKNDSLPTGSKKKPDYTGLSAEAIEYLKKAEQGDPAAQCYLGNCYYDAQGVKQDFSEAVNWYSRAAEQGHAPAQCNLGVCYLFGQGVKQDFTVAVNLFRRAAEQGFIDAQCNLAYCYSNGQGVKQDNIEAANWNRKAAEQGLASAQFNLGGYYFYGKGVQQDYQEAIKWYLKAAEQGLASAQFNLGVCYAQGFGVTQNYIETFNWFCKAAEQGYADAQYNLGICYERGLGVKQDIVEAVNWYRKAAKNGNEDARKRLNELEKQ